MEGFPLISVSRTSVICTEFFHLIKLFRQFANDFIANFNSLPENEEVEEFEEVEEIEEAVVDETIASTSSMDEAASIQALLQKIIISSSIFI